MDISDLYQALEFSRYAERLRDEALVIALSRNTPFRDLLLDFKVLNSYHIKLVIIAPDPNFELESEITLSNTHGTNFKLIETNKAINIETGHLEFELDEVRTAIANSQMPVVVHHGLTPQTARLEIVQWLIEDIALGLNAKKVLAVGQQTQALEDVLSRTRVTYEELENLFARLRELNLQGYESSLRFVQTLLDRGIPEFAYLVGKPGRICEEVFTHEGAGILFSKITHAQIRQAEISDVIDIALQIRPQVEAGKILPVEENTIAQNIDDFWVYDIDGQIVAVMRIKDYGEWAELATGATLFRDRKFGRASDLFMHLLEEARKRKKKGVFGLGINPKLEKKLLSLGFREVTHRELPQAWQAQYDFSRPSRAFILEF